VPETRPSEAGTAIREQPSKNTEKRKECTMNEYERIAEFQQPPTTARASEWSSDGALDPGDSHVKGESSLCVGEAA
jgi:hypothetical protein